MPYFKYQAMGIRGVSSNLMFTIIYSNLYNRQDFLVLPSWIKYYTTIIIAAAAVIVIIIIVILFAAQPLGECWKRL